MSEEQIRALIKNFNFRLNADLINVKSMQYVLKHYDLFTKGIDVFNKYIDYNHAYMLNTGIIEYVLVKSNDYEEEENLEFMLLNYNYSVKQIAENLDVTNKHVNNQTLTKQIKNNEIDPYLIINMSKENIHPESWKNELEKMQKNEDSAHNYKISDLYTCRNCKEKNTRTYQQQTRSADEPMTTFVTCLVCYKTFTVQ